MNIAMLINLAYAVAVVLFILGLMKDTFAMLM